MIFEAKFQIGKNGVTQGVIDSINLYFKTHHQLRIAVLKSAGRDKIRMKEMAEDLVSKVAYKSAYRVIGFTIILIKLSKKALS